MKCKIDFKLPIRVRDGYVTVEKLDTPHIIAKFKRALSVWRNKRRAYKNAKLRGALQSELKERKETIEAIGDQLMVLKYEYMCRVADDQDFYKKLYELDPENVIEIEGFEIRYQVAEYKGSKAQTKPVEPTPDRFQVARYKSNTTCNTPLSQQGPSASSLALQATG